jgi:hypothetical protein
VTIAGFPFLTQVGIDVHVIALRKAPIAGAPETGTVEGRAAAK